MAGWVCVAHGVMKGLFPAAGYAGMLMNDRLSNAAITAAAVLSVSSKEAAVAAASDSLSIASRSAVFPPAFVLLLNTRHTAANRLHYLDFCVQLLQLLEVGALHLCELGLVWRPAQLCAYVLIVGR